MFRHFLLLIIFLIIPLNAQIPGSVQIKVSDKSDGSLLAGAVVKVEKTPLFCITDKAGRGVIEEVSPGSYIITVQFTGYRKENFEATVVSGKAAVINAALAREIIRVPEVTVSAARWDIKESPVTVSNISREDLEKKSIIKDIPSVLSTLPATTFYSENGNGIGYNYIRIRGFDQRRVSVLINGVPQNDPEDHSVYWINFFELSHALEDIQIQRGTGTAIYGPPSIGGSVNLLTRTPSSVPGIKVEKGLGTFNTSTISVQAESGLLVNHLAFMLRVSETSSDGYRDWSWAKFRRFYFSGIYFDSKQSVKLNFFGGPQEDGLAFYGIPKSYNNDENLRKYNYGKFSADREFLTSPQVSITHDYFLSDKLKLNNTVYYFSGDGFFDFDASWGTNDYFRLDTSVTIPADVMMRAFVDNDQYGWLPRLDFDLGRYSGSAGLELRTHRSQHWGRIERGTGLPENVVGEKGDKRFYDYKGGKDILSFFLLQNYAVTEKLKIQGNLQIIAQRYRIFEEKFAGNDFAVNYTFVNPQAGFVYAMNGNLSLYGNMAFTMREPPLKNLYEAESASWGVTPQFEQNGDGSYNYDKPIVKPEKLFNIEAGIRYQNERLMLNANIYRMSFTDEIVPSGGLDIFGQPRVGNASGTEHIGLEIESAVNIISRLDFQFNLNWSRNRYISFTEYGFNGTPLKRDGNYIAGAPELIINSALNYTLPEGFIALSAAHSGVQYADNSVSPDGPAADNITVDPYTILNLSAGYNLGLFNTRLKMMIEINNLLDSKILLFASGADNFFPLASRSIFFKAALEIF